MKILLSALAALLLTAPLAAAPKLRALIIDGQNNHEAWPRSSAMMKAMLEDTGLFTVDIRRTAFTWKGAKWLPRYQLPGRPPAQDLPEPKTDPDFAPNFADYAVVVSNFGWKAAPLPAPTQHALEDYMQRGGGLVVVHAADNSWPEWREFNRMIGLGGWGGRGEKSGPYVYYDDAGQLVRDASPGPGGAHGPQREFQVVTRAPEHPIMRGLPPVWVHTKDECYDRLRGPAENLTVLATAHAAAEHKGSGRHEPMLMTVTYGQGRVFHTTLGHDDYSFASVGFIVTFCRGAEWAATGTVTQPVPADFPTATESGSRDFPVP